MNQEQYISAPRRSSCGHTIYFRCQCSLLYHWETWIEISRSLPKVKLKWWYHLLSRAVSPTLPLRDAIQYHYISAPRRSSWGGTIYFREQCFVCYRWETWIKNSGSQLLGESHEVVPFTFESNVCYITTGIHTKSIRITAIQGKESGFKTWYLGSAPVAAGYICPTILCTCMHDPPVLSIPSLCTPRKSKTCVWRVMCEWGVLWLILV